MYKNILIPVALDHEDVLPRKIETAQNLLADGGQITLLTVLENIPGFVAEFVDLKPENHLMADVQTGTAGVVIARYAEEQDMDLVIVGSHRPGIQDYFLGSTASRVSRRAPCSVLIVR